MGCAYGRLEAPVVETRPEVQMVNVEGQSWIRLIVPEGITGGCVRAARGFKPAPLLCPSLGAPADYPRMRLQPAEKRALESRDAAVQSRHALRPDAGRVPC